mgnify:CR=1 FL=1
MLDDDGQPALSAWAGGEWSPVCIGWASRARWVADVMRALEWSNAGQAVGQMDALTPVMVGGVLAARGEWSAIQVEDIERGRAK